MNSINRRTFLITLAAPIFIPADSFTMTNTKIIRPTSWVRCPNGIYINGIYVKVKKIYQHDPQSLHLLKNVKLVHLLNNVNWRKLNA